MNLLAQYIYNFPLKVGKNKFTFPWEITTDLSNLILTHMANLGEEFKIKKDIAIHSSATVEKGAVLKGPIIISKNCFIAANAYLRGGVFLGENVRIGPGCEIKSSIILNNSTIAHFNFVGDSIIGNNVNFEAGAHTANHHNDRLNKEISVLWKGKVIETNVTKFGSLIGDNSKIGANAVLFPGTILEKNSTVERLRLINQMGSY
jgi:UDP-N-acetylglucosamine diphosphorylase / glucose-1-phosphate thymidylyltransferase / UDP-N-acetylgalactosamine diphosphorylase / glucosamine-1-phosphate N-acetyltransferase / galactosamine-1-phosphate N-acetyltransferase